MNNTPANMEKVRFNSQGIEVIGELYLPDDVSTSVTAIVILGPVAFVKEQSPIQYAKRLAKQGIASLIFDPRYHGESSGEPRRYESLAAKAQDVNAALDFLKARPEIDNKKLIVLGICQGASAMLKAAAENQQICAVITVTGQFLYPDNIRHLFEGGGPSLEERIARGHAARMRYEQDNIVLYTKIVDPEDNTVMLPPKSIWAWYEPWERKSRWENRYTTMSDAEILTFDLESVTARVQVPVLVIHGDKSDGGYVSPAWVLDRLAASDKTWIKFDNTGHTAFYDNPVVIDKVVFEIKQWVSERFN